MTPVHIFRFELYPEEATCFLEANIFAFSKTKLVPPQDTLKCVDQGVTLVLCGCE